MLSPTGVGDLPASSDRIIQATQSFPLKILLNTQDFRVLDLVLGIRHGKNHKKFLQPAENSVKDTA